MPGRIMGRKRCEPSKAVIGQQVLVKVSRWNLERRKDRTLM